MTLYNYGEPERIHNSWQAQAMCVIPENSKYFHAPREKETKEDKSLREERAKEICRRCPVISQCYELVLSTPAPIEEVQAGLSPKDYKDLLKALKTVN